MLFMINLSGYRDALALMADVACEDEPGTSNTDSKSEDNDDDPWKSNDFGRCTHRELFKDSENKDNEYDERVSS